jgi:hypothetical protein
MRPSGPAQAAAPGHRGQDPAHDPPGTAPGCHPLILDKDGTHTHPRVQQWLEAHPRYHWHFTPKGANWLNQLERFFAELTRKRVRRGSFRSVRELQRAIREYVTEHNRHARPFVWTASASKIIRKVRHCKQVLVTGH